MDKKFDPGRRRFGKAVAGALGAAPLVQASLEQRASYEGLGRPPMKWGIKHSMQTGGAVRDEDLKLARQLGMEWVNTWASPDRYKEIVARVQAAGLKVAKIGNGSVHNRAEIVLAGLYCD